MAPPSVERAIQIGRCPVVGDVRKVTCTVPSGPTARSGMLAKRPLGGAITAGGENVRPWSVERTDVDHGLVLVQARSPRGGAGALEVGDVDVAGVPAVRRVDLKRDPGGRPHALLLRRRSRVGPDRLYEAAPVAVERRDGDLEVQGPEAGEHRAMGGVEQAPLAVERH